MCLLSILWSSYRMPPPRAPKLVAKTDHFQSVRELKSKTDYLVVLGLVVGSIPSSCVVQLMSELFGCQSCSSGYSCSPLLCESSHRNKVPSHFWHPRADSPYTWDVAFYGLAVAPHDTASGFYVHLQEVVLFRGPGALTDYFHLSTRRICDKYYLRQRCGGRSLSQITKS